MNILLFCQDWFAAEFRAAGHNVLTCGMGPQFDIALAVPLIHINEILKTIPAAHAPDRIVYYDNSGPCIVRGLEDVSIPTLFYSVDAQHHWSTQKVMACLFDFTFVAQSDYLHYFREHGNTVEWLPLWASRPVTPQHPKAHDVVFVGTLNPALNPARVKFFSALCEKTNVFCTTGEWVEIFPKSEIVINQTVKGDVNFRVFEAMSSGAVLLTECAGNGLFELFEDGKHLLTYERDNVASAVERIEHLRADRSLCRRIAEAGREEILQNHLPIHRAEKMLKVMSTLNKSPAISRHFGAVANYAALGRQLEAKDAGTALLCYDEALRCLRVGMRCNETFSNEIACFSLSACIRHEMLSKEPLGEQVIEELRESYPKELLLPLVQIHRYHERGEHQRAAELAQKISPLSVEEVLKHGQDFIQSLLKKGSNLTEFSV